MSLFSPTLINSRECIGNSLVTINNAFSGLYNNDNELQAAINVTVAGLENVITVPKGAIVMWSGVVVDIQNNVINAENLEANTQAYIRVNGSRDQNWIVCTGWGGSPNLIGRFVLGSGKRTVDSTTDTNAFFPASATGGSEVVVLRNINIPKLSITPLDGTLSFVVQSSSYEQFVSDVTIDNTGTSIGGTVQTLLTSYQIAFDLDPNSQPPVSPEIESSFVTNAVTNQNLNVTDNSNLTPTKKTVQSYSNEISATVPESRIGSDTPASVNNMPPYYAMYYIMRIN